MIYSSISCSMNYPPIYNFPPFFTKQLNTNTWDKQLELWIQLTISYCEFHKTYLINEDSPLFINSNISRRLQCAKEVLDIMVGRGIAQIHGSGYLVYTRKIEDWASLISNWVAQTGRLGSICTMVELTSELDMDMLIATQAVAHLVKDGKATTFSSNDGSIGIKFL